MIDGDSDVDLVVTSTTFNVVCVLRNDGAANFDGSIRVPPVPGSIDRGDFNGDAIDDIVLSHTNDLVSVHLGNGSGRFTEAFSIAVNDNPVSVQAADLDGDSSDDLLVASNFNQIVWILRNDCVLVGDVNQDGIVNLLDVAPFVQLIVASEYQNEADANRDGNVDLQDVAPFVAIVLKDQ